MNLRATTVLTLPELHFPHFNNLVSVQLFNTVLPGKYFWWFRFFLIGSGGGDATRPLSRDGGVEELYGDPTVGDDPKV